MPDDTIPVPRALIEKVASGLLSSPPSAAAGEVYVDLYALLDPPKPPAPRLRVVNLDGLQSRTLKDWREWNVWVGVDLEAQPDLLTTLDAAIEEWDEAPDSGGRGDLKARIRAALGVE